ncbi:hypothetical protein BD779DRAFT_1582018 [Infundibulicybe gibba]|nr:hypothetical protein BD779DRAFT_1582018 [Infundibulicybe gibba]
MTTFPPHAATVSIISKGAQPQSELLEYFKFVPFTRFAIMPASRSPLSTSVFILPSDTSARRGTRLGRASCAVGMLEGARRGRRFFSAQEGGSGIGRRRIKGLYGVMGKLRCSCHVPRWAFAYIRYSESLQTIGYLDYSPSVPPICDLIRAIG